jgi:hypothetical protein
LFNPKLNGVLRTYTVYPGRNGEVKSEDQSAGRWDLQSRSRCRIARRYGYARRTDVGSVGFGVQALPLCRPIPQAATSSAFSIVEAPNSFASRSSLAQLEFSRMAHSSASETGE